MKYCRMLSLLICICLIINCISLRTPAQQISNEKATGELVGAWISVTSMAFPEAAPFLEAGKKLLDMLGVFGQPDATGEALKKINARLDQIEARINNVQNQINALRNDFFKEKNYTRLQLLRTKRELLQGLMVQLQEKPTQVSAKRAIVTATQNLADDFLDPELWTWSDMRKSDGQMLDPDFKPLPTLELYATTLIAWMTAIGYAYGDDSGEYVKQTFGPALRKHIAYLNQTLPQNIRERVTSKIDGVDKYPKNRLCNYEVYVTDQIRHLVKDAGPGQIQMPSDNVMCSVPEANAKVALESDMQRAYGIDVMEALASKLERLRTQGTLAEQYIGEFDKTKYDSQAYLYGVKPNGDLLWYWHVIVTKPQPQPNGSGGSNRKLQTQSNVADVTRNNTGNGSQSSLGRARNQRAGGAAVEQQGKIQNQGAISRPGTGPALDVKHLLQGPNLIGSGWDQFKDIMPAGKGSFYALTQGGTLKWYRNDTNWNTVGGQPGAPNWKGPINVKSGWNSFVKIVPGGDGVLYAIDQNGSLKWYKNNGFTDGSVNWLGPIDVTPSQPSRLGQRLGSPVDFRNFKQVFSGGEGVMYVITNDGTLVWYRHRGYLDGTHEWDGPKNVGTGWSDFTRVFSPGDGTIYAMKPTGEVLWYLHAGYKDGTSSWQGPVEIAADWNDFIFVFPQMWGTPTEVIH